MSFWSTQHLDEDSARGNFAAVPKSLEKLESQSHKSKHLEVFFFELLEVKGSNLWPEIVDWLFFDDDITV